MIKFFILTLGGKRKKKKGLGCLMTIIIVIAFFGIIGALLSGNESDSGDSPSKDAKTEYVSTIIAVADDRYITIDTINPNLDLTGNLVFEIPKDLTAQDFRLKYSDFDLFSGIYYFNLK